MLDSVIPPDPLCCITASSKSPKVAKSQVSEQPIYVHQNAQNWSLYLQKTYENGNRLQNAKF